jgi:hypothetical protein
MEQPVHDCTQDCPRSKPSNSHVAQCTTTVLTLDIHNSCPVYPAAAVATLSKRGTHSAAAHWSPSLLLLLLRPQQEVVAAQIHICCCCGWDRVLFAAAIAGAVRTRPLPCTLEPALLLLEQRALLGPCGRCRPGHKLLLPLRFGPCLVVCC